MADNFGLKIGLEGEKEFKKALSDINASFKVLGSEMKLVESQFDKNDTSVSALTARNEVLNKEIEAQRQKVETLRAALQNAAESFGENDRRTQNWQVQLNNAEAALNGMEKSSVKTMTLLKKRQMALMTLKTRPTISAKKSKTPENKVKMQAVNLKPWELYVKQPGPQLPPLLLLYPLPQLPLAKLWWIWRLKVRLMPIPS